MANEIIYRETNNDLSYDDFMSVYKYEDEDYPEYDIFELMYSQARLKGIRLRDHPNFVEAAIGLLEEADEMEKLNSILKTIEELNLKNKLLDNFIVLIIIDKILILILIIYYIIDLFLI